jgi:ATP-dependent helicase HrpA
MKSTLKALSAQLDQCMVADQHRLRQRLARLKKTSNSSEVLKHLTAEFAKSQQQRRQRLDSLPIPDYPEELPVSERRTEIAKAIKENQVVIVAGETGSGKTTQLPKICLDIGRGVAGLIGHTQPRRLAARSVASRIASELKSELGHAVGYKVRFSDHTRPESYIKLMTDGILLAESQNDHFLNQYDTLIIDEAHERSLNIDFLLGYLKQLLPKRPNLKLIITSATIDTERFAKHFNDAPIIEVTGRTYPVELRYRPLEAVDEEAKDRNIQQAILDAVDEAARLGQGDVLIFLPGEREIRETAESLRKHHPLHTEILPLYARLSAAEQNRVFQTHKGRRIVLATNVAETSLTVPGIRYVIDPGLARMSRYSHRTKVQRLPIEKVSQASANQRAGRCGRVAPGVCFRLYSEMDFINRTEFTEPEIKRSNLAAVILQMKSLRLGEVEHFPFVEPPEQKMISDGYKLLQELGAVDAAQHLTETGKQLAKLPVDPRIGRMVLAAKQEDCLEEVLVIASAISVQDPRERPHEYQQAADEKHRQFKDERSDFLAYLNLWRSFHEQKRHLSNNKLRKWCKENFISYLRMREWHDVHAQMHSLITDMGWRPNQIEAGYTEIHRALITGLLGNLANKTQSQEYAGARGIKLYIFPGSGLFKKQPKWFMAAELVETTRLYARLIAKIESEWIEQVAGDLCKRSYFEPHWEKTPAAVMAYERVTLYGLVINPKRKVHYSRIDSVEARQIFIRKALVAGDFQTQAKFFEHNKQLVADIETLEAKSRRRDVLVDEQVLYDFYDQLIPDDICDGRRFEKWRKAAEEKNKQLLYLTREDLMHHEAEGASEAQFPDSMQIAGMSLKLSYHFEPGSEDDGVTVTVPLPALNLLQPQQFDWLVPGLLHEKICQLLKSLPKVLRRNFVPVPDFANACLRSLAVSDIPLIEALQQQLKKISGVEIKSTDLNL